MPSYDPLRGNLLILTESIQVVFAVVRTIVEVWSNCLAEPCGPDNLVTDKAVPPYIKTLSQYLC